MTDASSSPSPSRLRDRLLATLIAWLLCAHAATAIAEGLDREALVGAYIDAQRQVRLPMLLGRALPLVVRIGMDRRFDEAGVAQGFGPDWNHSTPERDAVDAQADALVHELVGIVQNVPTRDEATELLAPLADADLARLVAFQQSEAALRLVARSDRSFAALLLSGLGEHRLDAERQAQLVELLADLGEANEAPTLDNDDLQTVIALTQRPGVSQVMQAQIQRMLKSLGPDPRRRIESRIEAEVDAAIAAYVARTRR
jgi:hypothetical protein